MNKGGVGGGSASVPTGCYKCGRPGHWSRDCPSSSSTTINPDNQDDNNNNQNNPPPIPRPPQTKEKQKTQPRRIRPKLTPDILLSSDRGIGHILRYFPRAFKSRGHRGRELNDLQHLLGLYAEWHSRLLPYYNFDQFIHKVEQVGSTKRVKMCMKELRDRVADGVDPTKLHEPRVEENSMDGQQEGLNMNNFEETSVWEKGIEEESCAIGDKDKDESSSKIQMTEDERNRMEANRLKALERAAARAKKKC